MSISIITGSDEWMKRLVILGSHAELLFIKVRQYAIVGNDTAKLFADLKRTRKEIEKILRDYCGVEHCDEEMEALEERISSENN